MLQRFIQDEAGMEGGEFAMVLGLICLSLIAAIVGLVSAVEAIFHSAANVFNP